MRVESPNSDRYISGAMLLAEIDPTATIWIPVAITVVFGFPVSLYASFVCARLVLFSQLRNNAIYALHDALLVAYRNAISFEPTSKIDVVALGRCAVDLHAHGHKAAGAEVDRIAQEVFAFQLRAKAWGGTSNTDMQTEEDDEKARQSQSAFTLEVANRLKTWTGGIAAIRSSPIAVFRCWPGRRRR